MIMNEIKVKYMIRI